MMDPALKEKWLKALRSGEFKQTQGQLENNGAYCCLGVLCVVAGLPIEHGGLYVVGEEGVGKTGYGPIKALLRGHDYGHLTYMNDGLGRSFSEIADHIEETL